MLGFLEKKLLVFALLVMFIAEGVSVCVRSQIAFQEGVQWSAASCLHIVDLTPLVGDFAHASLKLSWQLNVPVRYSCVVEPAMEDWLRAHLVESVTGDLLKGLIACPSGHHVPPVDPPAEHMDSKPVAPSMKRLSYVKVTCMDFEIIVVSFLLLSCKLFLLVCNFPSLCNDTGRW